MGLASKDKGGQEEVIRASCPSFSLQGLGFCLSLGVATPIGIFTHNCA